MYKAETADDVLELLDEYAKEMKVLPRYWDAKQLIEPPQTYAEEEALDSSIEEDVDRRSREDSGLIRTGKWFGGLMNDTPPYVPSFLMAAIVGVRLSADVS